MNSNENGRKGQDNPYALVTPGPTPAGKAKKKRTNKNRSGREWIVTAIIAVANMLFLALAGVWLSGYGFQLSAQSAPAIDNSKLQLSQQLAELNQRMQSIEQQLHATQLAIGLQQQLLASSSLDIKEQLSDAVAIAEKLAEPKQSAKVAVETVVEPVVAEEDWYINLANFPGEQDALALKEQLRGIGYQAQISSKDIQGQMAYLVAVPGYKDRESAESSAKQIMEQTNLNGLWVWKEE